MLAAEDAEIGARAWVDVHPPEERMRDPGVGRDLDVEVGEKATGVHGGDRSAGNGGDSR